MSEYFSSRPNPEAKFSDVFTVNWCPYLSYLFPPSSPLPQVLQENQVQQEEALIVAPFWPNKPCSSQVLSLAAQEPLIYKPTATNLILPQDPKVKHALAETLSLMVQ